MASRLKLLESTYPEISQPSPPAKERSFFSRSSTSTSYSTHRSIQNENEPFNISRESFDSYRRSFDISARAPISIYDTPPRQSLDSRRLHSRSSRPSFDTRLDRPHAVEEGFEEVGLNDEAKPKKRGLFARFSDHTESSGLASPDAKHASNHHNFLFTGRKRGQSGQGNELRSMSQPGGRNAVEVGAD